MTDEPANRSEMPWPNISRSTAADVSRACHACFWAWIVCHLTFSIRVNGISTPVNLLVGVPWAFLACMALRKAGPSAKCGLACNLLLLFWPVLTTVEAILGFTRATELKGVVDIVGWLGTSIFFTLIFRAWARGFNSLALKGAHQMMSRFILWYALPHAAVYSWFYILNLTEDASKGRHGILLGDLISGTAPHEMVALILLFLLLYGTQVCLLIYPLVALHRFGKAWQTVGVERSSTASQVPTPLELKPDDSADEAAEKISTAQDLIYRAGLRRGEGE